MIEVCLPLQQYYQYRLIGFGIVNYNDHNMGRVVAMYFVVHGCRYAREANDPATDGTIAPYDLKVSQPTQSRQQAYAIIIHTPTPPICTMYSAGTVWALPNFPISSTLFASSPPLLSMPPGLNLFFVFPPI